MNPSIRSWYSRLLYSAVLAAVGWYLFTRLQDISSYQFSINWFFLFLCVISVAVAYLVMAITWISLARSVGLKAPVILTLKAWFISQLGKYIPGKIAILMVRFDIYKGSPKRMLILASAIEFIASSAGAALLVLLTIAMTPNLFPIYVQQASFIGAIILLLMLWPPVLIKFTNFFFVLFGKEPIHERPTYSQVIRYVVSYMLAGSLHGIGLFCVFAALGPTDPSHLLLMIGIYEAAGLIGMAAVFAPGGIGVREGVLFLILPLFLPETAVVISVILIRIINTLIELLLAAISKQVEASSIKKGYST